VSAKILLIGNNTLTAGIAQDLINSDIDLVLATPVDKTDLSPDLVDVARKNQGLELLTQSRVSACRGSVGHFTVQVTTGQQVQSLEISQVVIAEDAHQHIDYSAHGLHPAASIVSLDEIEKVISTDTEIESIDNQAQTLVFLIGLKRETTPENTRRAMIAAQNCQKAGKRAYILTGNLKVGDQGLEQLYRQARAAGIIFIKFSHTHPRLRMDKQDQVTIEFDDEIAGRPFRLSPDLTVLDEMAQPTSYLQDLIRIFELETDPSGFTQADNVHRIGVGTNRAGILVAGPARNVTSQREHLMDMHIVALKGSMPIEPSSPESQAWAEIDLGSCIRCLTCHRLCPYSAVEVNTSIRIQPRACEACGLCAAECPREAIQVSGIEGFNMDARMPEPKGPNNGADYMPTIFAFCCSRSAFPAGRLAECLNPAMPMGLKTIAIPCAGSLSLNHLLTGFRSGADGILVLTCHTDNCHARYGNQRACERAAMLQDQFAEIGFDKDRLQVGTLAANMGMAFIEIVFEFEKRLRELGPSGLRSQQ